MSNKTKRFFLPEEEIPRYWYNIQADMVNKPKIFFFFLRNTTLLV